MEWNRKIEDKLTQNWQWLMRTVMLKEIVHVLIEDKIISLDFWMNLKEKQISEQDRNANFFFEVSKFTKERYRLFIEALKKGSHNDLADLLELKPQDDFVKKSTSLIGPRNERIKTLERKKKSPEHEFKQERSTSEIKRENSELRNKLTTISSHVGQLHTVTQSLTDGMVTKDRTSDGNQEKDSFLQRIHNIEEHEKYLELQETNLKQEIAIKHLRSEIVDLKIDLNHQINQLEIKLKDAHVKKELKEHEAENLLSKVTGLKTQMHNVTKELTLEREENSKLKTETKRLEKINAELHEKMNMQTSKLVSLENNLIETKEERDSITKEMINLKKTIAESEKITNAMKQENCDLKNNLQSVICTNDKMEKENKKLSSKVSDFEKEILDLRETVKKLETENAKVKMKLNVVPSWK